MKRHIIIGNISEEREKMVKKVGNRILISVLSLCLIMSLLPAIQAFAASNIVINGVDIGYAPGQYFTKSGDSCKAAYPGKPSGWTRCHNQPGHDCTNSDEVCNCMRYWPTGRKEDCQVDLKAVQCFGFVRYCQWKVYGTYDAQGGYTFVKTGLSHDEANLKRLLYGCAPATHIRIQSHSYCVVSTSESGATIAECNTLGTCNITLKTYTWSQLSNDINSGHGANGHIEYISCRIGGTAAQDSTKPVVTGAYLTNITPTGYDVIISASDNTGIATIAVGTWNDSIGIDAAKWKYESVGGVSSAYVTVHVDISDFGGVQGMYHSNVYAYDTSGNESVGVRAGDIQLESIAPFITEAYITNTTSTGYDVVVNARDDAEIAWMLIGTWNDAEGIDAAHWQDYVFTNASTSNEHTFHVDFSEFGNTPSWYHTSVYAFDACGNVSEGIRAGDFILGSVPILSNPIMAADGVGVTLQWSEISGAEKYRVFYRVGESGWTIVGDTEETYYTVTGLTSGTTYTFVVRCIDASGEKYTSRYDPEGKTVKFLAAPPLNSVSNKCNGITVKWNAVTGAEKYRVFYRIGDGKWTPAGDTDGTEYQITGLTSGTVYNITVRCIDAAGTDYTSAYDSNGKTITYFPAHAGVSDEAKAATCTATGLTEGRHCGVCGEILVEQKTVEPLGHSRAHVGAVAPTYTTTGLRAGTTCENCGEVFSGREIIPVIPKKWSVTLPSATQRIEEEAFFGVTSLHSVRLPETCESIGANAFAGCAKLLFVYIPNGDCVIDETAFGDNTNVIIVTISGSAAAVQAAKIGLICADISG